VAEGGGKVIKVQKIPSKEPKQADALESLDELCYYYPAYRLDQARRLPHKHVRRMLRTARRLKAAEYYNLAQIAAAPHTEKGQGVTDLLTKYRNDMDG
jgi:hypothetical protein